MTSSRKLEITGILVAIFTSLASLYFSVWHKEASLVGQVQFEEVTGANAMFSFTCVNNGNLDIAILGSEANVSDNAEFDGSRNYAGVIEGQTLTANSISTVKFSVPIAAGYYGPDDQELYLGLNLWLVDANAKPHSMQIPILSIFKEQGGETYGSDQSFFKIVPSGGSVSLDISQDGQMRLQSISR